MNVRQITSKGVTAAVLAGALAVVPMALSDATTAAARADSVNWDAIAQCETGGNWSTNSGNGAYGGLQFKPATWTSNGGQGSPATASRAEQIRVAENVLSTQGIGAWPTCGSKGLAAQVWGTPAATPATVPAKATGCAAMPASVFGGVLDLRRMCAAIFPRAAR